MHTLDRPPLLRPGWIVYTLFVLYPVFWVMGMAEFMWAMSILPLATWALLQPRLSRPPTVSLFVLYVVWAGFSIVRLDRMTRYLAFGMRYATYIAAIGLIYYVYNERRVSRTTFVNWVAMLWVWAIAGGYLGLLFPNVRLNVTPASLVLPRSVLADEYVSNMVRPRLAQVQDIFGVPIPRPSTLFAYTNSWGSAVGLLTPFFIAATLYSPNPRRRRWGVVGMILALPPIILSVNRGLWISVVVCLMIVAVRSFLVGRTAPLKFLASGLGVTLLLVMFTPIGGVVSGRLSGTDASMRAGIYREAWEGAKASPILGWGGPRPATHPFAPHVGTHGHLWFAMFSHGLVGLAIYLAWLMWAMYRVTSRHDPVSIMLASVVFAAAFQLLYYDVFGAPIAIIMIAIALVFRSDEEAVAPTPPLVAASSRRPATSVYVTTH